MRPLSAAIALVVLSSVAQSLRAETHRFVPHSFAAGYSASQPPVLTIRSGDRVETTTLDAAGMDATGQVAAKGPLALTGPFYVDGAKPGDLLVITIEKLTPAGGKGFSSAVVSPNAVAEALNSNRQTAPIPWTIDRSAGVVRLDLDVMQPGTDWKGRFRSTIVDLPLQPTLGVIGVAPGTPAGASAQASGLFGGNVNVPALAAGTRVMLPVSQPGALLYLGHGKARQGDGDITSGGISTPMEVAFSVEVVKKKEWPHSSVIRPSTVVGEFEQGAPRLETADYLMAIGSGRTLGEAVQIATLELHHWLDDDFGLSERSVSVLLGPTLDYDIASVNGPNATVVAKVRKSVLPQPLAVP